MNVLVKLKSGIDNGKDVGRKLATGCQANGEHGGEQACFYNANDGDDHVC